MNRNIIAVVVLAMIAVVPGDFALALSSPTCPPGQKVLLTHREGNMQYYKCVPEKPPAKPKPKPKPAAKPTADAYTVIGSCLNDAAAKAQSAPERDRLVSQCMQTQGLCHSENVAEAVSLRYKLNDLQNQMDGLKKQFALLNRSVMMNNAQLEEWRGTTQTAVNAAWQQGKDMIVDEVLGRLTDKLGDVETRESGRLDEINADINEISASEHIPTPQLNELKKLQAEKKSIEHDLSVINRVHDAQTAADGVDLADMIANEKYLEAAMKVADEALADPGIRKALNISAEAGKNISAVAKYGKSIVDSAYNLTAEACAWARINQMNQLNDQYLKTTQALTVRMKTLTQQINDTQTKIKTEYQCPAAGK